MILLDKPFLSDEMKQYIIETKTHVLRNEFSAAQGLPPGCYRSGPQCAAAYQAGERIYTNSENALDWLYRNIKDGSLLRGITLMKDKAALRRALLPLYPEFFFLEVPACRLNKLDFSALKLPFVLKPSVGFFSEGVYTSEKKEDWEHALSDIEQKSVEWSRQYPGSVVGNAVFILEQYITGEEYALDAYYDENGRAVLLNIMKHDFACSSDVSDRLYYTGKEIIEKNLARFTDFLNQANRFMRVTNFPVHVEIRVKEDKICPIEFNPMRFAGLCTTDIAYFAYGFYTYDYYLKNMKPDWNALLRGKEGKLYTLILLNTVEKTKNARSFDYGRLCQNFERVLCLRKTDHREFPAFGFLFTETRLENRKELDDIMASDLSEFTIL